MFLLRRYYRRFLFLAQLHGGWPNSILIDSQQYSFKGIPTPAAGITIASLPLIVHYQQFNLQEILFNQWLIYGIILLLSYLMVSNIPLMSLKFKDIRLKNNAPKYILGGYCYCCRGCFEMGCYPGRILAYVIVSLAFKNKIA